MTTGEQGRTPPDAEHYLDLSDVPEEDAGPQFDVALRGYDRRQVDEHVAGLRRMVAQLRAQLAVRERRSAEVPEPPETPAAPSEPVTEPAPAVGVPEARQASADESSSSDMVGAFNDRLRGILQAAEQEAQLVRSRAAESLLAEHAESRAALADLRAQRDAVFDELMWVKGRLDDLVSNSGRPPAPPRWQAGPARPMRPVGPRPPYAGPRPGMAPGPVPPPEHDVEADTSETPRVTDDMDYAEYYAEAGRPDGDARS